MVNDVPVEQGKPTAYLDQNILDLFVDGKCKGFSEKLRELCLIVYSDETLKEIKRAGDFSEKFLMVLKELDAHHLKPVMEQPEFKETDQATLSKRDPFDAFLEYCQSESENDDIQSTMEQWLFKFSGGLNGVGISEIHNNQKIAFSNLMSEIKFKMQELSDEIPGFESYFLEYESQMTSNLADSLDETERLLKQDIPDDKNWSGIKELRKSTGIGPKQLNNFKAPGILNKIWKIYKDTPPYRDKNFDVDEFFRLKENPIYPDRPYFKHQKVTSIYNMLNSLGYWPDSKVHKERRFVAALSDNSHASMASFCNLLFSRDEAFVKKVKAAYEYLELPTSVHMVVLKSV